MLDTVVIPGDDVCCSVVFGVVISIRVPESGVCVHISGEDWVWYVRNVLYAVLYVCAHLLCSAWMWCIEEVYTCLLL